MALLNLYRKREKMAAKYVEPYRHYYWPVHSVSDLRLAPFHLLATEGSLHADQDHTWHMEKLSELCRADEGLLLAASYRVRRPGLWPRAILALRGRSAP